MDKKTLYLVRHAKSSWDYPELADIERPLNKRGKRDAPEMGNRVKQRDILPSIMISSPAKRALKTCKVIAGVIGYPAAKIVTDHGLYHASEEEILEIIAKTGDQHDSIMLFGHNPSFTSLANDLCNGYFDNVPTSGIVAIAFDIEKWGEIRPGNGQLVFFDYPKKPFSL